MQKRGGIHCCCQIHLLPSRQLQEAGCSHPLQQKDAGVCHFHWNDVWWSWVVLLGWRHCLLSLLILKSGVGSLQMKEIYSFFVRTECWRTKRKSELVVYITINKKLARSRADDTIAPIVWLRSVAGRLMASPLTAKPLSAVYTLERFKVCLRRRRPSSSSVRTYWVPTYVN